VAGLHGLLRDGDVFRPYHVSCTANSSMETNYNRNLAQTRQVCRMVEAVTYYRIDEQKLRPRQCDSPLHTKAWRETYDKFGSKRDWKHFCTTRLVRLARESNADNAELKYVMDKIFSSLLPFDWKSREPLTPLDSLMRSKNGLAIVLYNLGKEVVKETRDMILVSEFLDITTRVDKNKVGETSALLWSIQGHVDRHIKEAYARAMHDVVWTVRKMEANR
jgi:hypothetical protein